MLDFSYICQKRKTISTVFLNYSTSASIEDADASISAIMNLISSQCGVAVSLDPYPSHGIVKDLIVLNEA